MEFALVNSLCPLFKFLRRVFPVSGELDPTMHNSTVAIVLVTIGTIAISGFLHLKNRINKPPSGRIGEIVLRRDAEYAEELQIQEALLYSASSTKYASSSTEGRPFWETVLSKLGKELGKQHKRFCGICLDNIESCQMFKNDTCSHSFCYDCTSKHITTKIAQKVTVIGCPEVSCNAALDVDACRLMIPEEALIQWDESVCQSLILDSQKLYCPFRDCSALLVDDSEDRIQEIRCPLCKRSFCAACRVPWHSEFTCKEFQKLDSKKGRRKEEGMVKILAKKKNWQKCANCKFFVEKEEGCVHMTCRCRYEFCYRCGTKWTDSHSCSRRSNKYWKLLKNFLK